MWLPITILKNEHFKMNICGLKRATMQTKIKFLIYSKKLVNTHFLVLSMFIDNIQIIDRVHFLKEIKHFQKPSYIRWILRWILWIMALFTQMSWWTTKC